VRACVLACVSVGVSMFSEILKIHIYDSIAKHCQQKWCLYEFMHARKVRARENMGYNYPEHGLLLPRTWADPKYGLIHYPKHTTLYPKSEIRSSKSCILNLNEKCKP
jgi:hypothetical protein